MIHSLTFLENWRCFKINDVVNFRPGVNLLVGDQGSGKSSILQALMAAGKMKKLYEFELHKKVKVKCDAGEIRAFDFEKDNLRMQHDFIAGSIENQVRLMFASHGQANFAMLSALSGFKNLVSLLDEPDMALSIRSISKLINRMKEAVNNGCQVIAAVHNPFLIWSFSEVFSLESRCWVSSKEFIKSQGVNDESVFN